MMKLPEDRRHGNSSSVIRKLLGWLLATVGFLCRVVLAAWATLAIFYSNLPWSWLRLALALGFVAFAIWALWLSRRPRTFLVFAAVYAVVLLWWSFIRPSHHRSWRPEVAVMPRAFIEGDRVRLTGYRNFDYRTRDDFTAHYEDREVTLSHLVAVDFFVSYWAIGPVGHTFVSFSFDNAPPVCVSIETRPEIGEGFSPVASLFKQFELIYIVGSERDLVRVRTKHRNEEVFLYRIRTSSKNAQRLFLVYLERINELADQAEFYHLLSNSCTINIVRYANRAGRSGAFDFRHLLNGLVDRYLYASGAIDTTLPFEEVRRLSRINDEANASLDDPAFPQRIRAGLPTIHP